MVKQIDWLAGRVKKIQFLITGSWVIFWFLENRVRLVTNRVWKTRRRHLVLYDGGSHNHMTRNTTARINRLIIGSHEIYSWVKIIISVGINGSFIRSFPFIFYFFFHLPARYFIACVHNTVNTRKENFCGSQTRLIKNRAYIHMLAPSVIFKCQPK